MGARATVGGRDLGRARDDLVVVVIARRDARRRRPRTNRGNVGYNLRT
jgi:hypothetical protein